MKLGYIIPSDNQFLSYNGKPLTGGHIEVYKAGTSEKYITYHDFDGAQNPFSILIPNDGRVVVLGDTDIDYDYYVYDSYRNLVFSRKNVSTISSTTIIANAPIIYQNNELSLDTDAVLHELNVESPITKENNTIGVHKRRVIVQEPLRKTTTDTTTTFSIKEIEGVSVFATKNIDSLTTSCTLNLETKNAVFGILTLRVTNTILEGKVLVSAYDSNNTKLFDRYVEIMRQDYWSVPITYTNKSISKVVIDFQTGIFSDTSNITIFNDCITR